MQKQSNFIEIALRHGCSPVHLLHIFRTPFPKNTSGRLLLNIPYRTFNSSIIFGILCFTKTIIGLNNMEIRVSLLFIVNVPLPLHYRKRFLGSTLK